VSTPKKVSNISSKTFHTSINKKEIKMALFKEEKKDPLKGGKFLQ
jgi:hypothetical protein